MIITLFFTLSLAARAPAALPNASSLNALERVYDEKSLNDGCDHARDRAYESFREREFERKFNDVAKALRDFGHSWNRSHTIDREKANRLKKAWRSLAKTDAWFETSADR